MVRRFVVDCDEWFGFGGSGLVLVGVDLCGDDESGNAYSDSYYK